MANNTDLVKEIEEAERDVVYVTRTCHDEIAVATRKDKRVWIECCDKLRKAELTLQRARDALRWDWVLVETTKPQVAGWYWVTRHNPGVLKPTVIKAWYQAHWVTNWSDRDPHHDYYGATFYHDVVSWMPCSIPAPYTPEEK